MQVWLLVVQSQLSVYSSKSMPHSVHISGNSQLSATCCSNCPGSVVSLRKRLKYESQLNQGMPCSPIEYGWLGQCNQKWIQLTCWHNWHTVVVHNPVCLRRGNLDKSVRVWFPLKPRGVPRLMFWTSICSVTVSMMLLYRKGEEGKVYQQVW